jgi:hypothetical protein
MSGLLLSRVATVRFNDCRCDDRKQVVAGIDYRCEYGRSPAVKRWIILEYEAGKSTCLIKFDVRKQMVLCILQKSGELRVLILL